MKKIKLLFTLTFIIILTGCYNYRELNNLAITSAIGINKKGDNYELVIQVVNTQKQGSESNSSGDQPKFVIYKSEGRTIQEALRNIVLESPKRLYANHMAILIISEDVAKDGLDNIIDIFARDSEFRKQFMVLISKENNTDKILDTLTALVTLNSKNIKDSITTDTEYLGASDVVNFEDLLAEHLNKRQDMAIPSVKFKGDEEEGKSDENIKLSEPSARLILSDLGVFKGDKLVGYLEKQDSINVSFLKNQINNTIYTYECEPKKYVSIEITKSKTDIKPTKNKEIDITIDGKATINEINCDINLRKDEEIKKLEKKLEKSMEKSIKNTIDKIINEYHSDIIGFEDMLYKEYPHYYKSLLKEDKNILKNTTFKVKVNLDMYAKGNILKEV